LSVVFWRVEESILGSGPFEEIFLSCEEWEKWLAMEGVSKDIISQWICTVSFSVTLEITILTAKDGVLRFGDEIRHTQPREQKYPKGMVRIPTGAVFGLHAAWTLSIR
jgi:hypothetical protein